MAAPATVGPYRVMRPLGSGGMGSVYLAWDQEHNRPVALKQLHSKLPTAEARFRREFRLLQKLRHPYVVEVFNFGEEDGSSYLVMEFVQGKALTSWSGDVPQNSQAIDRLVEVARRIAEGLDYIHRQGIVHRDLKPENILVTADGTPKISDFGLARQMEETMALTQAGAALGTFYYSAPEQIMGKPLDHRADLYAYGVMLYRVFCGEVPFQGSNLGELALKHLREPPQNPRLLNPALPQPLEELILQLLAKNPQERPSSAAQVVMALGNINRTEAAEAANPSGRLLEAPLLGREPLIGKILKVERGLVILEGEVGLGKTRLMQEISREMRAQSWRTLWAQGRSGQPGAALSEWLNRLLQQQGPSLQETLEREGPMLAHLLPNLPYTPALLMGEQGQLLLFGAALRLLRAAGRKLLLVLDNAEATDEVSLGFVGFAARAQEDPDGLRVFVAFRSDEMPQKNHSVLQALERSGLAARFVLPALSSEDIRAMVEGLLGNLPEPELVRYLQQRSQGNPWMVRELVQELMAAGQLVQRAGYWEWSQLEAALPESLRESLKWRFDKLSEEQREVVGLAAVIGEEATFEGLLELSGKQEDDLLDDLDDLLRAGILRESRQGREERYRFSHPLLRQVALEQLSQRRRRRLHAKYAETLEERGASPQLLAWHYAQAENPDKAAHFALEAAKQAEAVFALPQAEPYLRLALEQLEPQHPLRPAVARYLGRLVTLTGGSQEAEELLAPLPLEPETALALAELRQRQGRWAEAIALIEPFVGPQSPLRAWLVLISCLRLAGRVQEALERSREAEQLSLLSASERAYFNQLIASIHRDLGNLERATYHAELALKNAKENHDLYMLERTYMVLGRIASQQENLDLTLDYLRQARDAAYAAGDWRGLVATQINLANTYLRLDDLDTAIAEYLQALRAAARGDYRDLTGAIHNNLGEVYRRAGELEKGLEQAEQAIPLLRELGNRKNLFEGLQLKARLEIGLARDAANTLQELQDLVAGKPDAQLAASIAWNALLQGRISEATSWLPQLESLSNPDIVGLRVALLALNNRTLEAWALVESLQLDLLRKFLQAKLTQEVAALHWESEFRTAGLWEWAKLAEIWV